MHKLIFHIGHSKTGSTSIQFALDRGLCRHPGQVLYFPGKGSHMPLALALGDPAKAAECADRFNALNRQLHDTQWDVAVVSSEQFEFCHPKKLREAIETWLPDYAGQVRIVVYVRPHVERLVANHVEAVKLGFFFEDLKAYHLQQINWGLFFFFKRLSLWRDVFGDVLEVRPMIRERLFRNDVVQDFFRVVFRDEGFELAESPQRNKTLSWSDVTALREFNKRIHDRNPDLRPKLTHLAWHFAPVLSSQPNVRDIRPGIDRQLLCEVRKTYSEDARQFDAAFCGGEPLFATALDDASATALDAPLSMEASDYWDADTLRLIHAYADILHRVMEAGPKPFGQAILPETGAARGPVPQRITAPGTLARELPVRLLRRLRKAFRIRARVQGRWAFF